MAHSNTFFFCGYSYLSLTHLITIASPQEKKNKIKKKIICSLSHSVFMSHFQVRRIRATTPSFAQAANAVATAREHKATVTLAAVLGAFVICWFPYFTYFTYMGMWAETHPNKLTHSIVLWLGYLNSALNPILYPALNRDFRRACAQLLCCRRSNQGDLPFV